MVTFRHRRHRQKRDEEEKGKEMLLVGRDSGSQLLTVDGPPGAGELGPSCQGYAASPTAGTSSIPNNHRLFDSSFWLCLLKDAVIYITLLAMASLIAYGLRPHGTGIVLLGILPSAFILYMLQQSYHSYVLKSQMVWTFFHTVWWMSPICECKQYSYTVYR